MPLREARPRELRELLREVDRRRVEAALPRPHDLQLERHAGSRHVSPRTRREREARFEECVTDDGDADAQRCESAAVGALEHDIMRTRDTSYPPYYDSLLGKLIVHGEDRDDAIALMARALADTTVEGVSTTVAYLRGIITSDAFGRQAITTDWVRSKELAARE